MEIDTAYKKLRRSIGPASYVAPRIGLTQRSLARRENSKQRIPEEAFAALRTLTPVWFKDPPPCDDPEFKVVPGCPGYAATRDGRCKSCATKDSKREYLYQAWADVSPTRGVRGYWVIGMTQHGRRRQLKLHQAVLMAYHGAPPFAGAQGRHLDDDKDNNHVDNLVWGTCKENKADAVSNGKLADRRGVKHPMVKLSEADVEAIKKWRTTGATLRVIAEHYGVTESSVSLLYRDKSWKHTYNPEKPKK